MDYELLSPWAQMHKDPPGSASITYKMREKGQT